MNYGYCGLSVVKLQEKTKHPSRIGSIRGCFPVQPLSTCLKIFSNAGVGQINKNLIIEFDKTRALDLLRELTACLGWRMGYTGTISHLRDCLKVRGQSKVS